MSSLLKRIMTTNIWQASVNAKIWPKNSCHSSGNGTLFEKKIQWDIENSWPRRSTTYMSKRLLLRFTAQMSFWNGSLDLFRFLHSKQIDLNRSNIKHSMPNESRSLPHSNYFDCKNMTQQKNTDTEATLNLLSRWHTMKKMLLCIISIVAHSSDWIGSDSINCDRGELSEKYDSPLRLIERKVK